MKVEGFTELILCWSAVPKASNPGLTRFDE